MMGAAAGMGNAAFSERGLAYAASSGQLACVAAGSACRLRLGHRP